MSTYRLDKLFSPRSVALIGASPRPTSPGRAALRNLRSAGFKGPIHLNPPSRRRRARGATYSGVDGIAMQGASLQESMGPIVDRTKEALTVRQGVAADTV
jgi:hypothetical protein